MRKGQAAIEFLQTYGWMLLALGVVMGALSYTFIINPSNIVSEQCFMSDSFDCVDFVAENNVLTVSLKNIKAENLTSVTLYCDYLGDEIQGDTSAMPPGSQLDFRCDFEAEGLELSKGIAKFKIAAVYRIEGNQFDKTADGSVTVNVR